jgi:hypothetical protein
MLDAYLDGQLTGPARDAFEARLARDPALAAELALQRRMDGSLRAMFVATPFPGVPSNGHPAPLPHQNGAPVPAAKTAAAFRPPAWWRWAAAAAVLMLAVGGAWAWMALREPPPAETRRGFAEIYREQFLTGMPPAPAPPAATQATARATTEAFDAACAHYFGRTLKLSAVPAGLELEGVSQVSTLSPSTVMLRARIDGEGVLVFVDRMANDDGGVAAGRATGCGNGCCGVRIHRRQVADLVLYEMTPRPEAELIQAIELIPAAATGCSGAPGAPHEDL